MPAPPATYSYAALEPGDPIAPVLKDLQAFQTRIDPHTGRPVLLCLIPSLASPPGRAALARLAAETELGRRFGGRILVTADAQAAAGTDLAVFNEQVVDQGLRILRAVGAVPREPSRTGEPEGAEPGWVMLDPSLHVLEAGGFSPGPDGRDPLGAALAALDARLAPFAVPRPPPVLMLPNVFTPALCQALVAAYDRNGGTETGVVVDNETVLASDMKRRRDYFIAEPELIQATHMSLSRRILPEIERLFFMKLNRITRNIVSCYSAADGAHFLRPHRDNVSEPTRRRRFAVSVNLTGDFEGGQVVFPEYGDAGYTAPPGWALVFPCNIVHLVTRVETGARYVWLPFLYEDPPL